MDFMKEKFEVHEVVHCEDLKEYVMIMAYDK